MRNERQTKRFPLVPRGAPRRSRRSQVLDELEASVLAAVRGDPMGAARALARTGLLKGEEEAKQREVTYDESEEE